MASLKPVGINSVLSSTDAGTVRTAAISHQGENIRVVALSQGVHVAIGTLPTATADNFFVPTTDATEIAIGKPQSQRVVGVTTGTSTVLDFPEGTGSPFAVGDACTLTVTGQSNFDFTHKIVTSIDNSAGVGGYFATRITVDHDSSSVTDTFSAPYAELRGSFMVAVKTTSGTGTVHVQQVQTA